MGRVKHSTLAGTWYAGTEERLRQQVDALLADAASPAARGAAPVGVVVPHAGYVYSGRAAAAGYARMQGSPTRRVVILAPSHFAGFRGAAIADFDAFATPLGLVEVDGEALAVLRRQPLFHQDAAPFEREHALEVQLPFVQRVVPKAGVVPVLLGEMTAGDDWVAVANGLRLLEQEHSCFVVSSDLVHYGAHFGYLPFPAEGAEEVGAGLRDLDMGAIDRVCAGEPAAFFRYVADTGATICGRVPIGVWLTLHRQRSRGLLLSYYTSLDVTGDYQHCVSYASIAFPRPQGRESAGLGAL